MGVLDGIKILELARVPPAELPGMMLADVGADVLKIETPEPDRPSGADWVRRTINTFTNRNKRSMSLNMKSADGQEIFRRLAAAADVVVEGFRPGVMKRLAATPNMRFFFSDGIAPRRGEGFLGGSYPYYAIYETRDGKLLTIGCTEPWLWENFCKAIERPELARFARTNDQFVRAANAEEEAARREIEAIIRTRDRDEWYERLVRADVCVGKVYEIDEMVRDPQLNHRQMIVDVEHPTHGRVRQIGIAIKLSDTPGSIRSAAPLPGEHTAAVLKDLGLGAADIGRLREKGIIE